MRQKGWMAPAHCRSGKLPPLRTKPGLDPQILQVSALMAAALAAAVWLFLR